MKNLNHKLIRGEGIDQVDLTKEDIEEYEDLYNSDQEDQEDEGDDQNMNMQGDNGPQYNEVDEHFSGNYRFYTDVRY